MFLALKQMLFALLNLCHFFGSARKVAHFGSWPSMER